MAFFSFGRSPSKNPNAVQSPRGRVVSKGHTATASSKMVTASPQSGGNQQDRFNPAFDRLDEGSVVEDWIPRDLPGINKMMRGIYTRDGVAGPAIDILSLLPWSPFDIVGVDDKAIREFYEDAAKVFGEHAEGMRDISTEYLVTGRFAASMLYNDSKGFWDDYIPHDSDFLTITPIPIQGFDPKLDLQLSPAMTQFLSSQDYRDRAALQALPDKLVGELRKGGKSIPLDPLATLWCARKVAPHDFVGTSIYTRIIPFWALEKALLNATVTAARRRAGNILHVNVGLEDRWEPTDDEMSDIAGLFVQADEDPVGAVVVTRTGVEANEIRDSGSLWKLSDEWQYLAEGKMRALGISEALLSGEATYTNMEQARNTFVEQIRQFRMYLTNEVYLRRFRTLARAHGFVKRKKSELDHRVRIAPQSHQPRQPNSPGVHDDSIEDITFRDLPQEEALEIPDSDLIVPEIYWHKTLQPEADDIGMELMERLQERGFPVTLQMIASRAGQDLEDVMESLEEDAKLRDKVNEWKKKTKSEDDDGGFGFASTLKTVAPGKAPFWDRTKRFMGLHWNEAVGFVTNLSLNGSWKLSSGEMMRRLNEEFDGNTHKIQAMAYLLQRIGVARDLPIDDQRVSEIAGVISGNQSASRGDRHRELLTLAKLTSNVMEDEKRRLQAETDKAADKVKLNAKDVSARVSKEKSLPPGNILTGVVQ